MIIKKKFLLIIFFALASCGYQSIYAKKDNSVFFIKEINLNGNKEINRTITEQLPKQTNNLGKTPYNVELTSNKLNNIIARDSLGNPSIYSVTIDVKVVLKNGKIIIKERNFNKDFSYNAMDNKFDQLKYQKNIEKSLTNKISEEIFIFLYY
tara:strand:- start:625 stop:1080 length:456 start_codon:yes stop_codon:yes gene_type:complete